MTDSLEQVFNFEPNVALVCTPAPSHVALAAAAIEKGCDVFVEKPLSHGFDGIDALIAAAEKNHRVTMVGCNMRFHPGPATVRRLLREGAIGRVLSARIQSGSYLPNWRPETNYRDSISASAELGGGALLECIHEIDLAIWYLGDCEVIAAGIEPASSIGLAVDGLVEILLRHRNGALSSVHLNFVQRDYRRGCQIIGEHGTLYWDFEQPVVRLVRGGETETIDLPSGWQVNDMYISEFTHFFEALRTRAETQNPIRCAAETLRIALAAKAKGTRISS